MKMIPVKIAVSVARRSDGEWAYSAFGSSDQTDDNMLALAGHNHRIPENRMHWVVAELPIPEPEVTMVAGRVEDVK